jgi:hypothetical protein
MRIIALVLSLALGAALAACEDSADKPYLVFAGGGFVFNYHLGQAYYGFVAKPGKALPEGATIEARFEVPGSDQPFVMQQPARDGMLRYAFRTPPLKGIIKDHQYQVELRVIEAGSDKILASYSHSYYTDVDQKTLPDKPLVLGPNYAPNPEVDLSKLPAN